MAPGTALTLVDRSSLTLAARGTGGITVDSSLRSAGGSLTALTSGRSTPGSGNPASDIRVADGVVLDLAGHFVNSLLDGLRSAVNLAPQSSGAAGVVAGGTLSVGSGAVLSLDPGAPLTLAAGRRIDIAGSLLAPGGTVSIDKAGFATEALPDPYGVLSLGPASRIDVSGTRLLTPGSDGLLRGRVLDAGSVTLRSPMLLWAPGARITADTASGALDGSPASLFASGRQTVAGKAGTLDITLKTDTLAGGLVQAGGGVLAGQFSAQAASASAATAGGQFKLTLTGDGAALGSPPRTLTLQGGSLAASLPAAGDAAALAPLRGQVVVDARALQASGIQGLQLRSSDTLAIAGDVALDLSTRIVLDAPVLSAAPNSHLALRAASISLGNSAAFSAQQSHGHAASRSRHHRPAGQQPLDRLWPGRPAQQR